MDTNTHTGGVGAMGRAPGSRLRRTSGQPAPTLPTPRQASPTPTRPLAAAAGEHFLVSQYTPAVNPLYNVTCCADPSASALGSVVSPTVPWRCRTRPSPIAHTCYYMSDPSPGEPPVRGAMHRELPEEQEENGLMSLSAPIPTIPTPATCTKTCGSPTMSMTICPDTTSTRSRASGGSRPWARHPVTPRVRYNDDGRGLSRALVPS
jgi:hypothetical protein